MKQYDVIIIGGGVMGAFSARALARSGARVAIVEQYTMFNPYSASGGKTRSFRCDYLDPLYAGLALKAAKAWRDFESETGTKALVSCGCLNLWDPAFTVSWDGSYGGRAAQSMRGVNAAYKILEREELPAAFACSRGLLDLNGGLLQLGAISAALAAELTKRLVRI